MKKLTISALILALFGAVALTSAGKDPKESAESGHDSAVAKNLMVFNALVKELEETYVDTIRTDEAFKTAIAAMLNTVDPYTEYYSADDTESLTRLTTGAYGGIGAYIQTRDGGTVISLPIEGSPSFKAGLKAGDRLLDIDTVDVRGKGSDVTTRLLKGEPGTTVNITVQRPYAADSVINFSIVRERVQERSVPYYGLVNPRVGYVRLSSFMENSPEEVKTALESFKANPDVKGVILDLRGNGGGLVESAIEILGYFLPKGTEVLKTKGRTAASQKTYKTTRSPLLPDMPLVVLTDGGSASASEITAGALQDLDRAVLVGTRSFGKGLVQGTRALPFEGLLKITTAKYYIPSGRLIQALDYSHRNPDGSVARTPDSLTNEYLTRAGRKVRDGGGLTPDTVVKHPEYSRLLYNLLFNSQIFDYATKFAATHPEIPAPDNFVITDEIFADFVASVDTAKVYTDKIGRTIVADLRSTARTEGFLTPELEAQLETLAPLVEPDLQRDLYNRREEISRYLGEEIVSRYYSTSGESQYSLPYDEDVKVAVEIIEDPGLYGRFLGVPINSKSKKSK